YYCSSGGVFVCGSELPALRALSPVSWAEDFDSTADYFRYGFCLPGYTAWKGVFEVLPGHWLRWGPGRAVEQHSYWQLPQAGFGRTVDDNADLYQALSDAVSKRLIADVEVGAFLSGGIDSSLVCALAQRCVDRPLKTFTIGFSEAKFDESDHAAMVANHLGTDHHCEVFDDWDKQSLESLLCHHVGQPFSDVSISPSSLVSRVAAQSVKVTLYGDGADALFGGYQRKQASLILRLYTRLPPGLRRSAEKAVR